VNEIGLKAAGFDSFEHFVYNWHDRIVAQLRRLKADSRDLEDLRQEVYFRIIKTGHLEKFDPLKGSFQTHIYRVSQSVAVNRHKRRFTRPLDMADSLVESSEGEGHDFRKVKVLELLLVGEASSMESLHICREDLSKVRDLLSTGYVWSKKTHSTAVSHFGPDVHNTLWQVAVWLFIDGWKVSDLAEALGVRHGSVSNWKSRVIKKSGEVRAA